jgi:hypothetical protein
MARHPRRSFRVLDWENICDGGAVKLTVEEWPIGRFAPYLRNPRNHEAGDVDRMCEAIREFGFRIPVVAKSDGLMVDGHLRLKAAKALGMETVPVALADELTDDQVRAFRLLANKSSEWASWDHNLLNFELSNLEDAGFDLTLTGFDEPSFQTEKGPKVKEVIETGDLQATFWISLRGPLADQARVLDAVKAALGEPGAVEIETGVIV